MLGCSCVLRRCDKGVVVLWTVKRNYNRRCKTIFVNARLYLQKQILNFAVGADALHKFFLGQKPVLVGVQLLECLTQLRMSVSELVQGSVGQVCTYTNIVSASSVGNAIKTSTHLRSGVFDECGHFFPLGILELLWEGGCERVSVVMCRRGFVHTRHAGY